MVIEEDFVFMHKNAQKKGIGFSKITTIEKEGNKEHK